MNEKALEEILSSPRLPTLPAAAVRVLELTQREDVDIDEVAEVVRFDQALASKVLRTVNSSFYSLSRPCTNVRDAMVYLGLNTVKTLVLGFGLVHGLKGADEDEGFNFPAYWRRELYTAVAARQIAAKSREGEPEEAFLAGLLQDIGMVALYRLLGEEYLQLMAAAGGDHALLIEAERDRLQLDHAVVGSRMAVQWKLPGSLVTAIEHHHSPEMAPEPAGGLARIAELAANAAEALLDPECEDRSRRFHDRLVEWLGCEESEYEGLLESIRAASADLAPFFEFSGQAAPNAEQLMDRAEEQLVQHQITMQREAERLREANESLVRQSMIDPLTGVANRRAFDELLRKQFEEAARFQGCLGLIFCDIDHFKQVNDTHGHQVGDVVLADVAWVMRREIGERGTVCRYGGEEFAVVLPGRDRIEAARTAEALRRAVAEHEVDPSAPGGVPPRVSVTVSLGVAAVEPRTSKVLSTPVLLTRRADQALYAAKTAGRNCVRVFHVTDEGKSAA